MSSQTNSNQIDNLNSLVFQVVNGGDGIRVNGVKFKGTDFYHWFTKGQRKLTFHIQKVQNFILSKRSFLRQAPVEIIVPGLTPEEFVQYYDKNLNRFIFRGSVLMHEKEELTYFAGFSQRLLSRTEKMKATKEKNKKLREERLKNFMANNSIAKQNADKMRNDLNNSTQSSSDMQALIGSLPEEVIQNSKEDSSVFSTLGLNSSLFSISDSSRLQLKSNTNPRARSNRNLLKYSLLKSYSEKVTANTSSIQNNDKESALNKSEPVNLRSSNDYSTNNSNLNNGLAENENLDANFSDENQDLQDDTDYYDIMDSSEQNDETNHNQLPVVPFISNLVNSLNPTVNSNLTSSTPVSKSTNSNAIQNVNQLNPSNSNSKSNLSHDFSKIDVNESGNQEDPLITPEKPITNKKKGNKRNQKNGQDEMESNNQDKNAKRKDISPLEKQDK